MVNMSHDTDDRRTGYHFALVFFILFQQFLDHVDSFQLFDEDIVAHSDLFGLFEVDLLIDRIHLALHKQILNDL